MSLEQIKKLRSENRFEEGYKLTKDQLLKNTQDIWAKRNHSWSIYYMIKKFVQGGQTAQAKHYLNEFNALEMPIEETLLYERMEYFFKVLDEGYLMIRELVQNGKYTEAFNEEIAKSIPNLEQLSWIGYYMLKSHNKSGKPVANEALRFLGRLKEYLLPSKKLVNKLLLQELIKTAPEFWNTMNQSIFLEKAGLFEVLEEDDFQKQEWEGKKIISLAERLHIAYSKALLREGAELSKINEYLQKVVEPILEKFPNMLYVPYFKAKLLLGSGNKKLALEAFLPFAKKKSGEFWVWQVFAETFEDNPKLYKSCLCKAMTCKTKPEFLSNIQEKLIAYFIKIQNFNHAKAELDKLLIIRETYGWGLRSHHHQYVESEWYKNATAEPIKYREHIADAESLLGDSSDAAIEVVVHYINKEKNVFGFLLTENKSGFSKFTKEPELYSVYKLYGKFGEGEFFRMKKMEKANENVHPLIKEVKGELIQKIGKEFGNVTGTFLDSAMIKKYQLKGGDSLIGEALFGPVRGKDYWSWKMIRICYINRENG